MTVTNPASSHSASLVVPASLGTRDFEDRARELQESVAPDLYTPNVYVPWSEVTKSMKRYEPAIGALQDIIDADDRTLSRLADWLKLNQSLSIVRALFAAPQPVGFADGRSLPETAPRTQTERERLATLIVDLGIWHLLPLGARVTDVVRVGEVGLDSRRRGFRRRDAVQFQLTNLLNDAIQQASDETGVEVTRLRSSAWPKAARGRATAVLAAGAVPVAAVANVFQSQGGGRQWRDLSETYPALQRDFDAVPMSLLLILDGRGVRQVPSRILIRLLSQVGACMSGSQAADGGLAAALAEAVQSRGIRAGRRRTLDALIDEALNDSLIVTAEDLPDSRNRVLLAFGEYIASHPDRDLDLDVGRAALCWRSPTRVEVTHRLRRTYDAEIALDTLATMLGMRNLSPLHPDDPFPGVFGNLDDAVLPSRMLLAAVFSGEQIVDANLLRTVGQINRQRDTGGGVAALVVPRLAGGPPLPPSQHRSMATSVVVLDAEDLDRVATSKAPRDAFVRIVLAQADLTKANPFTVTGATGRRMFYGRGAEDALLQNTLLTNSAALIGGRRIGKTSLLQHTLQRFADGDWNTWYADCQAVGSWAAFAAHVRTHWKIEAPGEFSTAAVDNLFSELASRGTGGQCVVMLDEVDNLLRWDRGFFQNGGMNEPLFRALRGLSQERTAQFVFTGERLIASVLWDPTSPHWNFCRAIPVRQLAREDSDSLLATPLEALGVKLVGSAAALDEVWAATSGHPQIIQQLGETLVNNLNNRPPDERSSLNLNDILAVTTSPLFLRNYAYTYWGQATPEERLITALLVENYDTIDRLAASLARFGLPREFGSIEAALRMLDLYGLIDASGSRVRWRATRFPQALQALGGSTLVRDDLVRALVTTVPPGTTS